MILLRMSQDDFQCQDLTFYPVGGKVLCSPQLLVPIKLLQDAHQVTEYSPVSAAFHARMGTGVTDVCTSQPNFDMGAGR